MANKFFIIGAFLAFLAVAIGAFGAHGLKSILSSQMLVVFETGVRYHMYHALAVLVAGWASETRGHPFFRYAGWSFLFRNPLFFRKFVCSFLNGNSLAWSDYPPGWRHVFDGLAFVSDWFFEKLNSLTLIPFSRSSLFSSRIFYRIGNRYDFVLMTIGCMFWSHRGAVQNGRLCSATLVEPGPARPQAGWRAERTRQYVSETMGRERCWRIFSTDP